jgi:hypothetical protein
MPPPKPPTNTPRLNDFKTQEVYLNRIIERYMKLCALNRVQLDALFASVSTPKIATNDLSSSFSSLSLGLGASKHAPASTRPAADDGDRLPTRPAATTSIHELETVLTALRKLREAITASGRTDVFARRAYYFNIHVAILCHDWESYRPALHTLLHVLHPRNPLPPHDLKDFVGLYLLDQVCRQSDYAGARETKVRYRYADRRVEAVMRALVADDWVVFWRMRKSVDGYQRSVMEWADGRVRVHALKCLGRGYLRADKRFIERCTERAWTDLVKDGVGWELVEGDKVVIQRPKVKG